MALKYLKSCIDEENIEIDKALFVAFAQEECKLYKKPWYSYFVRVVDEDLNVSVRQLEMKVQYGNATGHLLASNMRKIVDDYNVDHNKISAFVGDGGANVMGVNKGMAIRMVNEYKEEGG
ncbi:hypothetical protein EIN_127700 [Entamoeba invadens IP1]|uniref:DUF4371 domain-containing protein n=1 Tax=Entamoeba invadens IP1 TaxID=370355 RepID=L7FM31_ENTIV|nr:hypothetical protein EIN_127700 [Entamoeba invadens IP1]ELP90185.1 hypothetical protein EIN_127700 [Entamoeba invadens IP1]|eukprot:XP_004256956.1 hypothetical protein EIN_127700 [Entamoeba invadens IP1]